MQAPTRTFASQADLEETTFSQPHRRYADSCMSNS
jgi:hypothetical protein